MEGCRAWRGSGGRLGVCRKVEEEGVRRCGAKVEC